MENTQLMKIKNQLKSAPRCPSWNPDLTPGPPVNSFIKNTSVPKSGAVRRKSAKNSEAPRNSYVKGTSSDQPTIRATGDTKCCHQFRRPDISSPHLKYGLFNTRPSTSSQKPECFSSMSSPVRGNIKSSGLRKDIRQDVTRCDVSKGRLGVSPVFLYQAAEKSLQLSLSEVMHLDIKPKTSSSVSPIYTPTASFKNMLISRPR